MRLYHKNQGDRIMPFFTFHNIRIRAVCSCVPKKVVKVDSFKDRFGEEAVDKFKKMTGIVEYRKSGEHQTASDLGYIAAEEIIKKMHVAREEIGALVFVAHSTDYRRPATACVLHKRMKLSNECAAYDISLGCSAFVYGVQVVASMMQCSDISKAILIVGETLTKMVNPEDRSTVMLFGDGASAVLLEKTVEDSNISGLLRTDGTGYKAIIAPAGGFRNMSPTHEPMVWADGNTRTLYNTNMNGTDVFSFTITEVPKAIKDFLERTNTTTDDYDCIALHQANKFIHKQLSKKLKVSMDKMPLCLDRYGNTSAPAIPLLLCDAFGNDEEDKKIRVLMCGFGVGLSWGVLSAEINTNRIYPIIESDELFEEGIINSPEDM